MRVLTRIGGAAVPALERKLPTLPSTSRFLAEVILGLIRQGKVLTVQDPRPRP